MKGVSKRDKILLIILVICAVFYLYYRFFLTSVLAETSAAKENIDSYTTQIEKLKQDVITNEKLKAELNDLNVKFQEDLKVIPQYERDPEIAFNIKALGTKNNAAVSTVTIAQPTEISLGSDGKVQQNNGQQAANQQNQAAAQNPGVKLYIVPVNISAKGSYASLKGFITSLESDTRIAEVNTSNLSADQTAGSITATIGLNYYYLSGTDNGQIDYDFNKGTYGKQDLFK